MKIRSGFVSNSSSSSFIIDKKYKVKEIKDFVKEELKKYITKRIRQYKKDKFPDNWEECIKWEKDDLKASTLKEQINVEKVKDITWDLSEWYGELDGDDWILYDIDDNFINRVGEAIVKKFDVEYYWLHMG